MVILGGVPDRGKSKENKEKGARHLCQNSRTARGEHHGNEFTESSSDLPLRYPFFFFFLSVSSACKVPGQGANLCHTAATQAVAVTRLDP